MKLKRITAFALSALLMLLNMTNIVMATEQTNTIKVGIGEKVEVIPTNVPPSISVEDSSIANIIWDIDTKDNKYKVMIEGIKVGKTTASVKLSGEASPKIYNIEVMVIL